MAICWFDLNELSTKHNNDKKETILPNLVWRLLLENSLQRSIGL